MPCFSTLRQWFGCLLGAAALGAVPRAAAAQTSPPAWASAQNIMSTGAQKVVADAAGNTYVAGLFDALAPIQLGGTTLTSQGLSDGYLAKFTPGGTLAWVRQFGSARYDACQSVSVDASGNVYVVGSYGGPLSFGSVVLNNSTASPRGFVMRFDGQGTAVWAQEVSSASLAEVKTNAAGELYVVGLFSQPLTVGTLTLAPPTTGGTSSVFLLKLGPAGDALQASVAYTYVPSSTSRYYYPALHVGPGGEAYVYGPFVGNPQFGSTVLVNRGGIDGLVAKYSPQGVLSWVQQIGGGADDQLRQVSADAAGNVYATGYFTGSATIGTTALTSNGAVDGYVAKFGPQGTAQWAQPFGGSGIDLLSDNLLDAAGNLYVTGTFNGSASFGGTTLTGAGGNDIVLASLTPQGSLRWVQQAGGPGNDSGLFLTLDGSQQLRVTGFFDNNCQFGSQTLTTSTSAYYLASLGSITSLRPGRTLQALRVYPNPARSTAQVTGLPAGRPLQLYNALGRVVRTGVSGAGGVSVQGLAPGIYTLRATDAAGRPYGGRLVVE